MSHSSAYFKACSKTFYRQDPFLYTEICNDPWPELLGKVPWPTDLLSENLKSRDASVSKNLQWSLMTHLNSLEESTIVILHQPAVQHHLQRTFCKFELKLNVSLFFCLRLWSAQLNPSSYWKFGKKWKYHFCPSSCRRYWKILTLASIWPLAPLVPPKGWLDTKESLAVKVFVHSQKRIDVCFTKVLVWKMITWTPHLVHIPNLAGDKSLLVKVVLNIASFESSEKIFQSLRFPRRIKLGYLEAVKICVEVFPWCDVGRYSHRYFFVVQTLRS